MQVPGQHGYLSKIDRHEWRIIERVSRTHYGV